MEQEEPSLKPGEELGNPEKIKDIKTGNSKKINLTSGNSWPANTSCLRSRSTPSGEITGAEVLGEVLVSLSIL